MTSIKWLTFLSVCIEDWDGHLVVREVRIFTRVLTAVVSYSLVPQDTGHCTQQRIICIQQKPHISQHYNTAVIQSWKENTTITLLAQSYQGVVILSVGLKHEHSVIGIQTVLLLSCFVCMISYDMILHVNLSILIARAGAWRIPTQYHTNLRSSYSQLVNLASL